MFAVIQSLFSFLSSHELIAHYFFISEFFYYFDLLSVT